VPSAVRSDDPRFQVISKNLFQSMKLKSLSLRNLGIRTIELDAFDKDCCQQYLETLDLSGNYLRRLDEKLLRNLKSLERLILANNQLAFGERNFQANSRLKHVDLSGNALQYITPNLFYGLNKLESIELSRNNLHSIEACVFDAIDTNNVATRYNPPKIYLNENPIECDCDLFYLNRHRNYKLNLTCSSPEFYKGRNFNELAKEDPSKRCDYESMEDFCELLHARSNIQLYLIVLFVILTILFLIISVCCCCSNITLNNRLKKWKQRALCSATSKATPPSQQKQEANVAVKHDDAAADGGDKEKLLV
jgi:hypothetical protein